MPQKTGKESVSQRQVGAQLVFPVFNAQKEQCKWHEGACPAAFQGVKHRPSLVLIGFFIHENLVLSPALVEAGKPNPGCRDAGRMLRVKENTISYCCKATAELEKAHGRGLKTRVCSSECHEIWGKGVQHDLLPFSSPLHVGNSHGKGAFFVPLCLRVN